MSLPLIEVVTPLKAGEPFNVTVTTTNCATTSLVLLAREFSAAPSPPLLTLPIRNDGVTRFSLAQGHYVFAVGFENVNAPASLSIDVVTNTTPCTAPAPLASPSAQQFVKGSYSFDVYV